MPTTELIAVVGPTGTGKSDLAISLAQYLDENGRQAAIVNADSMQFYRGMDIGTAKLPQSERGGVTHHLLDWLEVKDESTAAEYQSRARALILQLQKDKITPILVGGSMLYVAAVLNNFEFPARDAALRQSLEEELIQHGSLALHQRLESLDPIAASRIIPQNGRRIVRALEIVLLTGQPFAAALPDEPQDWQPVLEIGLNSDRENLKIRLANRVSKMWNSGLLGEVEGLIPLGIREGKTASQAIGYAQALAQLDGRKSEQEAIAETIQLTNRYARRQMSWFKRDGRIQWLDYQDPLFVERAKNLVQEQILADAI